MLDPGGKVWEVWLLHALSFHKSIIGSYHTRNIEHVLDFLQLFRQVLTIFALVFITSFHNEIPYPVLQHVNVILCLRIRPFFQMFHYSSLQIRLIVSTKSCLPINFISAFSLNHDDFICEVVLYFLNVTLEDLLVHIDGSLRLYSRIEVSEYLLFDLLEGLDNMLGGLNDIHRDVSPSFRLNILRKVIDSVERIIRSSHQAYGQYRLVISCFSNCVFVLNFLHPR